MINLTPHAISVQAPDGTVTVYAPSGSLARIAMTERVVATRGNVPIICRVAGKAEGIPDAGDCLVSSMVLEAAVAQRHAAVLEGRLFAPDTGPTAIRAAGQIVAVTRLVVGQTI